MDINKIDENLYCFLKDIYFYNNNKKLKNINYFIKGKENDEVMSDLCFYSDGLIDISDIYNIIYNLKYRCFILINISVKLIDLNLLRKICNDSKNELFVFFKDHKKYVLIFNNGKIGFRYNNIYNYRTLKYIERRFKYVYRYSNSNNEIERQIKGTINKKNNNIFNVVKNMRLDFRKRCIKYVDLRGKKVLCMGSRYKEEPEWFLENKAIFSTGIDVCEGEGLECMDMHDVKYSDNEFDIIYSCHSFEHSYDPEKLVLEINRLLKCEGMLLLCIPTGLGISSLDVWDFKAIDILNFFINYEIIFFKEIDRINEINFVLRKKDNNYNSCLINLIQNKKRN